MRDVRLGSVMLLNQHLNGSTPASLYNSIELILGCLQHTLNVTRFSNRGFVQW